MSLKRGLETLPPDRETEACVRELLLALRRHEGEWLDAGQLARIAGLPERCLIKALPVFADARVVERRSDPAAYRFVPDRLLTLEVDSFLRRADVKTGKLQNNVSRFRTRYGR